MAIRNMVLPLVLLAVLLLGLGKSVVRAWCTDGSPGACTNGCLDSEYCTDNCCVPKPGDGGDDGGWTCFPAGTDVTMADRLVSRSESGEGRFIKVMVLDGA
jgi:hypothetical protein